MKIGTLEGRLQGYCEHPGHGEDKQDDHPGSHLLLSRVLHLHNRRHVSKLLKDELHVSADGAHSGPGVGFRLTTVSNRASEAAPLALLLLFLLLLLLIFFLVILILIICRPSLTPTPRPPSYRFLLLCGPDLSQPHLSTNSTKS